jgi:tRNA (guanine-N7-)-methyltransferase
VRRQGRLTPGQAHALKTLWPRYGLESEGPPCTPAAIFGRRAFAILEVGFGNGEALLEQACAHPEQDYLGIEVYLPGVGRLLRRADEAAITNLRLFKADALDIMQNRLATACLDRINVFFPDPWPKKRHHKRRLVRLEFASLAARVLKPAGELWLATDWQPYAEEMLEVMLAAPAFYNIAPDGGFHPHPMERPVTKFEKRGQSRGHGVWDLCFRRENDD